MIDRHAIATLLLLASCAPDYAIAPPPLPLTAEQGAALGRRLWTTGHNFVQPCPRTLCPGMPPGDIINPGTPITVVGYSYIDSPPFALIRLDDGTMGYIHSGRWQAEDPKAISARHAQQLHEDAERGREARATPSKMCLNRPSIAIGMTADQVQDSKWGTPWTFNTTDTGRHKFVQWVYNHGPWCNADGTLNSYGGPSYLYFEDGALVSIQKAG